MPVRPGFPNATILISSKESEIKEITISNVVGEYEFRALPFGRYSIEVRKPGFRIFQQQALELHANERRSLDVVLEVGEVDERVNVVAKAPPAAPPDTRPARRAESASEEMFRLRSWFMQ